MAFDYILADLLARNEDALGAIFLDESGEMVEIACGEFSPYQLKIVGAYTTIYLRQIDKLLSENDLGEMQVMHIAKDGLHIYASPLPEGYCLLLVQRPPALTALARRSLRAATQQIRQTLFEN